MAVRVDDLAATCGSADLVASLEVQPIEGLACLSAACHEVSELKRRRNWGSVTSSIPPRTRIYEFDAMEDGFEKS